MNYIILALFLHFVADFVFQNEWMANNKWDKILPLYSHCLVYALFFIPFGWWVAILMLSTHIVIDSISSQITHYLWEEKRVHDFFVVIGFDQFLHISILIWAIKTWWEI